MGLYAKYVVPWAIHLTMKNKDATRHRLRMVPAARGRVLEIGIGSGLNLPFYGPEVSAVTGLDPSAELLGILRRRRKSTDGPFSLDLVEGSATATPFEDGDFDTVVTTWTLCSIPETKLALAEMRRVLKPGGRYLFIEHGRAPTESTARWQDRVNPVWRRLTGGCNMNRPIDRIVQEGGFELTGMERFRHSGPGLLAHMYRGIATPAR